MNKLEKMRENVSAFFSFLRSIESILVQKNVRIAADPYEAALDAHAIVVCTEWDEFTVKFSF